MMIHLSKILQKKSFYPKQWIIYETGMARFLCLIKNTNSDYFILVHLNVSLYRLKR